MPLRILKLAFSAEVETTMNPVVTRLFHVLDEEATEGPLTLAVEDFETDSGDPATVLPDLTADNSYYNCYINGILQMQGITSYTPGGTGVGELVITVAEDETISTDTTIILEIVNYSPASAIDVTT